MALFKTEDPIQTSLVKKIERLSTQLAQLEGQRDELNLADQVAHLKKEIVDLEIKRDKQKEDHDRREREVKHMVGLEKKRGEFETDAAKREAVLEVKEEGLTQRQERFEEEMKFQRERFESEVGYLKELMGEILERLPTVTVDKTVTSRKR